MKKLALIILLLITSCKNKPTVDAHLSVDKKSGSVNVMGLDAVTLQGIKRDSIPLKGWQALFPVYAMPADTGLRNYQSPLPGRYAITDNTILFTPDTDFKAGRTYFARYYNYDIPINAPDLILHRRVLGRGVYTELIFKY